MKYRILSCIASAFLIAMLIVPSGMRAAGVGAWNFTTSVGEHMSSGVSLSYNGYIYLVGGYDNNERDTVYYAPTNPDGTVGVWNATTPLLTPRYTHGAVIHNGFMYVIGGSYNSSALDSVEYALICDGTNSGVGGCGATPGTVGTWGSTSSPGARFSIEAAVYGDYVYVAGGYAGAGFTDSVMYAHFNTDGTIGSWVSGTSLPESRSGGSLVVNNGNLYEVSGDLPNHQSVVYAAINPADGSIGAWNTTSGFSGSYFGHGAVVFDKAIYVVGGVYNGSLTNIVMYAPINSDGTLGSWVNTSPLGINVTGTGLATSSGGYLYAVAGQGSSGGVSSVEYSPFNITSLDSCDTNSVVYCGAYSPGELLDKVINGDGLHSASNMQQIFYTQLGFTPSGISDMVDGVVYANGDIYVNGVKVAENGRTFGRDQQHPDDTHVGLLWERTGVNFRAGVTQIDVLVNMDGGQFNYAVMKPCGNPIVATPVTPPTDESPGPSPSGSVAPPPTHNCCQLTNRSVTLGSSVVSANTTADFSWKRTGVSATLRAVKIQVCTTTSYTSACIKPTGANMSAVTLASTGGELGASGWSLTALDDHTVLITKTAGAATTVGVAETVGIAGFVNPSVYGSFSFRISTYNTTDADNDDVVDCGTVTTSTAKSITTSVDVAEMLVFRVANEVAPNCTSETDIADPNDSTEDLVTLSPDPISLTTAATSTAQFCIVTNAGGGYVITYRDEALGGPTKGFWNGAHEFPVVTNFTSTPGTEQFGFNLRANTVPVFGADPDAAGLVTDLTNPQYSTVNQYSYNDTGTAIVLASKAAPSASARYTLAYLANISSLTPAGTYQAHQVFVATAAF